MTDISRGPGKHYFFEKFEFYADGGMITLIDTQKAGDSSASVDEYHFRIRPGEFLKRAISARMAEPDKYASKVRALRNLLENATEACKLALRQGDLANDDVAGQFLKHKRQGARLILPGFSPDLPPMPGQRMKIKSSDNPHDLSKSPQVVPDITIDPSTVMTPARAKMAIKRP